MEATGTTTLTAKVVEALFPGGIKSGKGWALFFSRLALGFLFIWGGYTKMGAWANGRMATSGFLSGGSVAAGPLVGFFNSLAGNWTVEYLVVFGEFFIGVSLIFGTFVRVGAISGALQMLLFTVAMWPIADTAGANPLVDYRVIYGVMFVLFIFTVPGRYLGGDGIVQNLKFVKDRPKFKRVLQWLG